MELGGDAIAVAADCTKPEQLSKMFDQIIDHYGKVDGTLLRFIIITFVVIIIKTIIVGCVWMMRPSFVCVRVCVVFFG